MKAILGISAFYHDSAAAIAIDGEIIVAAQEERFTRKKHTELFPIHAIEYCLAESGYSLEQLDAVVFYDKPFLTFERLLESYYAVAPKGLLSFLKAIPVWLDEKLFLKKRILDGLQEISSTPLSNVNLLFTEHHLSHAASAFFTSTFEDAAILTIDGVGEWSTASIALGEGNLITTIKEIHFPHSVGLLYSAFTYFLGFKVNSGEYKLMGLAPYGIPHASQTASFIKTIKEKLVTIYDDGSIWMDMSYFNYLGGLRMVKDSKWESLFGFSRRDPDAQLEAKHCNLALAIQMVTEEIVIKMAKEAKKLTGKKNLCMAGGVALNCVANGKLHELGLFENIYIQPAAGDAGGAIGAALAAYHMHFEGERVVLQKAFNPYLGPYFSNKEIEQMNRKVRAIYEYKKSFEDLTEAVAEHLAEGAVVGWFQGRMEFGPRALGNRSILGDPTKPEMQKKINLKIKYREGFRPFAPSVLKEETEKYFQLSSPSEYMLLVAPVREEIRHALPDNYHDMPLMDKLYHQRSSIQAVTHIDFSARVQTVDREMNPEYWQLIHAFKQKTGHGLLVNTSFNVRGEPIVHTPFDAYRCFMSTEMDVLVIGNHIYRKEEQPEASNKKKWILEFDLD